MDAKKVYEVVDDASMTIGGSIELIQDLLCMFEEYHGGIRSILKGYALHDPTDGFIMIVENYLDRIDRQTERLNNLTSELFDELREVSDAEKAS